MKSILKSSTGFLLIVTIVLISCSKNSSDFGSPPAPTQPLDTLRGREFEFKDLVWKEILSPAPNVIIDIDKADLFYNPFRELKITIMLDTSTHWMDVFRDTGSPYPSVSNFFYTIGGSDFFYAFHGHLYIYPISSNHTLTGTKAAIKVKFL